MEPLDIEILELFMQLTEDERRDALAFAEELVDGASDGALLQ